MRYLLFGTGDYYQRYKKWFGADEVVALIDNSPEKQHTIIDGFNVISPEEINGLEYDHIVILSFYVREMKRQLVDLGVDTERIFHFFDLYRLGINKRFEITCYGAAEEEIRGKRNSSVLLLSTDLELQGGPATGLIRVARILKQSGTDVVFGSMQDGPQKEKLLAEGIPVVIDPNLQVRQMVDVEWTQGFRKVICNTIGFNVFISKRDKNTPIVWWLHDSSFFYDGVDSNLLKNTDFSNVEVYSVGKVPKQAIQKIVPTLQIKDLIYGVEEPSEIIYFIVLGYIEPRKGQDILLDAIRILDKSIRERALFYFVGNDTSEMAGEIKKQAVLMPQVVVTGRVSEIEKKLLMKSADVLICPSREDPMPASVVEAMLMRKATIVSDATGIADYLEDGKNGMIFASEDSHMLAQKIEFCIRNVDKVRKMSEESYRTYKEHFSMSAFEERLLEII